MSQNSEWIEKLFLGSAFLGGICCIARADYNLPLFAFAYMAWELQKNQRVKIAWLIIFTSIIDLVWLLYWGSLWNSDKFSEGYWENAVHSVTVALSSVNLLLKVY